MFVDGKVEEAIIWHDGHEPLPEDQLVNVIFQEDEYLIDIGCADGDDSGRITIVTNKTHTMVLININLSIKLLVTQWHINH